MILHESIDVLSVVQSQWRQNEKCINSAVRFERFSQIKRAFLKILQAQTADQNERMKCICALFICLWVNKSSKFNCLINFIYLILLTKKIRSIRKYFFVSNFRANRHAKIVVPTPSPNLLPACPMNVCSVSQPAGKFKVSAVHVFARTQWRQLALLVFLSLFSKFLVRIFLLIRHVLDDAENSCSDPAAVGGWEWFTYVRWRIN
jgi:hypothetical protein